MKNNMSIDRDLGDCEIRSVSFIEETAHIKIVDPSDLSLFTIVFQGVKYFYFESNNMQNVIEKIIIFESIKSAKDDIKDTLILERLSIFGHQYDNSWKKIAYIEPIAGGEVLVAFDWLQLIE